MMTKKHKERVQQEAETLRAAGKASVKRHLLLGAFAVFIASGALAGSHMLLQRQNNADEGLSGGFFDATASNSGTSVGQAAASPQTEQEPGTTADAWNLILVNREYLLPRDFTVNLTEVSGYRVDVRIAQPLQQMLDAAKAEGLELVLVSGYRSVSKQRELYQNEVEGNQESGYDTEKSVQMAEQFQQPPGASEHHTGLAVDIISSSYPVLDAGFDQTLSGQWLRDHCAEYGFVLRYPENKEEITGILYEPWHFRYVGKDIAAQMQSAGLCLEEYLKNLED